MRPGCRRCGGGSFTFYLQALAAALDDMYREYGPVALVGHSAGGWIARIMLGDAVYDGSSWDRRPQVSLLMTLGTPHLSLEGYPFGRIQERRSGEAPDLPPDVRGSSLRFVRHHYPTAASQPGVALVCGAGKSIRGQRPRGPIPVAADAGGVAHLSYMANSGHGSDWGDGVCPLRTALLPGAQAFVMEDVWHTRGSGRLWYGSPTVIDYWSRYLPPGG